MAEPTTLDRIGEYARFLRGKISPFDMFSATDVASFAPGGGLVNAWQDSGRARDNLKAGNYGQAAIDYGNMALNVAGEVLPFAKLAIFAGPSAKTANLAQLGKAEQMASAGKAIGDVRAETGWFKGADDKWRFEIPDDAARMVEGATSPAMPGRLDMAKQYFAQQGIPPAKFATGQFPEVDAAALAWADERLAAARNAAETKPLRQVFQHDALYEAYPHLAQMPTARETLSGVGGSYNNGRLTYGGEVLGKTPDNRSVILHELQHAVQDAEGFARGGSVAAMSKWDYPYPPKTFEVAQFVKDSAREAGVSPSKMLFDMERRKNPVIADAPWLSDVLELEPRIFDKLLGEARIAANPRDSYRRLAGEVEARNVEKRRDMTADQRFWTDPRVSQDVPYDQQIIRYR